MLSLSPTERVHRETEGTLMSEMGHSRRFGFVRFRGIADMNS